MYTLRIRPFSLVTAVLWSKSRHLTPIQYYIESKVKFHSSVHWHLYSYFATSFLCQVQDLIPDHTLLLVVQHVKVLNVECERKRNVKKCHLLLHAVKCQLYHDTQWLYMRVLKHEIRFKNHCSLFYSYSSLGAEDPCPTKEIILAWSLRMSKNHFSLFPCFYSRFSFNMLFFCIKWSLGI